MLIMPNFIFDLYTKAEALKGKSLLIASIIIIIISIGLGIFVENFTSRLLNKDENTFTNVVADNKLEGKQFEGVVTYVEPQRYPYESISFSLVDSKGEDIILLSVDDEKLTVVEGLNVVVFGQLGKTRDGQFDVLDVEKVVVKNRR